MPPTHLDLDLDPDLGVTEGRCRRSVTRYRKGAIVITDTRASEHRGRTFVPAVLVALLHTIDTSSPDARDAWLANATYCFDFMHGGSARKGGR